MQDGATPHTANAVLNFLKTSSALVPCHTVIQNVTVADIFGRLLTQT
jgi:hypothetical protein